MRSYLRRLDADRKDLVNALLGNGMVGGDDLTKQIDSIDEAYRKNRAMALGLETADEEVEEFSWEAPMPQR